VQVFFAIVPSFINVAITTRRTAQKIRERERRARRRANQINVQKILDELYYRKEAEERNCIGKEQLAAADIYLLNF
jgi:hypothetical protein